MLWRQEVQTKRRFHVLHGKIRLSPERASTVITVEYSHHYRVQSSLYSTVITVLYSDHSTVITIEYSYHCRVQ